MDPHGHAEGESTTPEWPVGWHIEEVAQTGSTNADLLARADRAADRSVLRADHQTAGRGRLDRVWEAPPGANLLVSLLFRRDPGAVTDAWAADQVRRVGLAAVDAIAQSRPDLDVRIGLKWPNDVMLGELKVAGVLAQLAPGGAVIVGLGLNVGWAPEGAARVGVAGVPNPRSVLAELLVAFDRLPVDVYPRYRDALTTLGQRVRVELADADPLMGTAIDVDRDGALIVVDDHGHSNRISVGDVVHLRSE